MKRGLMPQSVTAAFQKARVNMPGVVESIYQPLYDYQVLLAAGIATQTFFQSPIGQINKTIADTNMSLAGQLPKGQAFVITGIQVEILPGDAINGIALANFADDVYDVLKGGALELTIGSKNYIVQGNLMKFPPVNRLSVEAAVSETTTASIIHVEYAQSAGREFSVIPLLLESSQNFDVKLLELAALPSGTNGRIGVSLNGYLFRNAQ